MIWNNNEKQLKLDQTHQAYICFKISNYKIANYNNIMTQEPFTKNLPNIKKSRYVDHSLINKTKHKINPHDKS